MISSRKIGLKTAGLVAACIALAQSNASANERLELSLQIEGQIPQRCSVTGLSQTSLALEKNQTQTVQFSVDCNTPFSYSLRSSNGGLHHDGSTPVASGSDHFDALASYDVVVEIPLEQGDQAAISDQCNSQNLSGSGDTCTLSDSGTSIAIDELGTLSITPRLPGTAIFLAGKYTDTLTIEVTAK